MQISQWSAHLRHGLSWLTWGKRPEVLVFLPLLSLGAYWLGGEQALLLLALAAPACFALMPLSLGSFTRAPRGEGALSAALSRVATILAKFEVSGRNTAALVVQCDDLEQLKRRYGRSAQSEALEQLARRLRQALRQGDMVVPLPEGAVAVFLAPVAHLDVDALVLLAQRLQERLAAPLSLAGARLSLSASIGFCLGGRSGGSSAQGLLEAAQTAAEEASRSAAGSIRAYSLDLAQRVQTRAQLRNQLHLALENGQIRPHFQPQISMDSGQISGLEALARWHHPTRGCLMPAEFLPAVEANDMFDRLSEVMLAHALGALQAWEGQGLHVPSVSVNFSSSELRNPRLPDQIRWELDRFGLTPERLTIEILETVIAQSADDVIAANIAQLARMGCGIDLDDFGTGHASLAAIRRFSVRRLKIDRSFVTGIDQDREQQKMFAAIISLSERLGLATLAEGVESKGEQSMLAQLGCEHVQGFGLARPMPFEEVAAWIARHRQSAAPLPRIGMRGR